jgi:hypothetical protein
MPFHVAIGPGNVSCVDMKRRRQVAPLQVVPGDFGLSSRRLERYKDSKLL